MMRYRIQLTNLTNVTNFNMKQIYNETYVQIFLTVNTLINSGQTNRDSEPTSDVSMRQVVLCYIVTV